MPRRPRDATPRRWLYKRQEDILASGLLFLTQRLSPRMHPRSGLETTQRRLKIHSRRSSIGAVYHVDGVSSEFGCELVRSGSKSHEHMGR